MAPSHTFLRNFISSSIPENYLGCLESSNLSLAARLKRRHLQVVFVFNLYVRSCLKHSKELLFDMQLPNCSKLYAYLMHCLVWHWLQPFKEALGRLWVFILGITASFSFPLNLGYQEKPFTCFTSGILFYVIHQTLCTRPSVFVLR